MEEINKLVTLCLKLLKIKKKIPEKYQKKIMAPTVHNAIAMTCNR